MMDASPKPIKLRAEFIHKVAELEEEKVLELVRQRIASKEDPLTIVDDCQEGLREVGERYERREYYLSGLIMAGEIFREVMDILTPFIEALFVNQESGLILLGTVQGDIHDIGKNNLSLLLTSYGFTIHDLGVDVSPQEFLDTALKIQPDIIGLSGLLTSSFDSMRETVELIRSEHDPQIASIPIIIGGNQIDEQVCQYVGADAWVTDAMSGVRTCQKWLDKINPASISAIGSQ
jgi:methanogenic corrinoid protein MtbC1